MKSVLCGLVMMLFSVNGYSECVIKFRVYDSPPFYFKNDQGNWAGLSVDLVRAMTEQANCKMVFISAPWKRALYLIKHGKVDLMSGVSETDERSVYIDFFAKQSEEIISLVVPVDSDYTINSLDDFKNLPMQVGMFHGSFYGHELKQKLDIDYNFSLKIQSFGSIESILHSMAHQRLSAFFYNQTQVKNLLASFNDGINYKVHPYIVNRENIYYGLSRKSVDAKLKQRLLKAYILLEQRGVFKGIYNSYK
ncbi:MAG: hypothetical protein OFPII_12770 [Osedax symbiont Rs1]|nr:MAG: hypothetical protein OFPII_12770 [Osedax symbiont Rs1]